MVLVTIKPLARNYGVRYLAADEFSKYSAELKLETALRELEYCEKIGITLPVARVTYPEEYVKHETLRFVGDNNELPKDHEWPYLQRLFDRNRISEQYADLSDEALIDSFDREMGKILILFAPHQKITGLGIVMISQ